MPYREYHYRWVFDLKSSPEQLWPFVADTNRFNRDTGVPQVEIEASGKRLPNARRRMRFSFFGMPVEWEERPFDWVRPERFGIERNYSKGPLTQLRVLAQLVLKPSGGTTLTYDVWAKPRNAMGAAAIPLQIGITSARRFRTAFERYDELASGGASPETVLTAESQTSTDRQRLSALRQRLLSGDGDPDVIQKLIDFIDQADDFSVSRIRPYQLADNWQQSRREVLEACLRATRVGLLDLQWDLLCPLCRGAGVSAGTLQDVTSSQHCDTCKIDFKVNFDRFVELTFRPNAAVRNLSVQEFCISSPYRSPHVVAQQLLKPGEARELELALEGGNYRLRALELSGEQSVLVSETGKTSQPVSVTQTGWDSEPVELALRSSVLLQNKTDDEQLIILERTAWSDQAATAAEVTALQVFRDLFSSEALRPGEQISVGTLTVLFTDLRHSTQLYREIGDATAFARVMNHFDVLKQAIAKHDGAIVKTIGDAVMAVFRSPAAALNAMLEAQAALANPSDGSMALTLKAGLHSGPCIAVTLNDRLDYFGSTVNLAARLEGLSSGEDVIISDVIYNDSDVCDWFASGELEASAFEMTLKGFDDQVQLWRVKKSVR
jgi:class 3 adenylate cyclase